MKRALTALTLAGTLAIATIATPTSAHAQWRHRSLSIDENSLFEGLSRRVEHSTEASSVDTNSPRKQDGQSSALSPYLHRVEGSPSSEGSESAIEPKHLAVAAVSA
jgi:hypothetical protein